MLVRHVDRLLRQHVLLQRHQLARVVLHPRRQHIRPSHPVGVVPVFAAVVQPRSRQPVAGRLRHPHKLGRHIRLQYRNHPDPLRIHLRSNPHHRLRQRRRPLRCRLRRPLVRCARRCAALRVERGNRRVVRVRHAPIRQRCLLYEHQKALRIRPHRHIFPRHAERPARAHPLLRRNYIARMELQPARQRIRPSQPHRHQLLLGLVRNLHAHHPVARIVLRQHDLRRKPRLLHIDHRRPTRPLTMRHRRQINPRRRRILCPRHPRAHCRHARHPQNRNRPLRHRAPPQPTSNLNFEPGTRPQFSDGLSI